VDARHLKHEIKLINSKFNVNAEQSLPQWALKLAFHVIFRSLHMMASAIVHKLAMANDPKSWREGSPGEPNHYEGNPASAPLR